MSHPQPPTRQPTGDETKNYARTMHNAAIGILIAAPVLALLPPRKLDVYTASLMGLTGFSVNYLHRERYGKSILQRMRGPITEAPAANDTGSWMAGTEMPSERAREFQRQFKLQQATKSGLSLKDAEQAEKDKKGVLDQVWYGEEKKQGWNERREQEIQTKMAEGKGYGDIIMDQIWEVWTWGKKDGEGGQGKSGGDKSS